MAGNKVSSKSKGKEDKSKPNKNISQNHEDAEDVDYSLLRKPIPTSITGFAQARKVFDLATEELKELLTNECDLLYECKVCRNLFRSLMNFISHKRIYCKEKFNCTIHSHFNISSTANNEILKIKKFEEDYQEFLKQKIESNDDNIDETDDTIPLTKDLTTVIEKIVTNRGIQEEQLKQQDVVLQKIPKTSVAVYQSIKYDDAPNSDDMRTQVKELDAILSKQNAIMQTDGTFKVESCNMDSETEGVIQISDDEDGDCGDNLKCKICDLQFSTQKTLKSHIKTKHLESRIVYPCPDCLEIFSTSWSVYRHLFKVHRKTAAQIRRMRDTIQSKAFRMNNPPAFYEKRKATMKTTSVTKITEEERMDQENQAWMDNMEGDGELPRCGGCGRTFERRAALAAHTNTCQPRSRALARRPHETKKIEIQIRKDYNKGPTNVMPAKTQGKESPEEVPSSSKPQQQKAKKETPVENTLTEAIMSIVGVTNDQEVIDNEVTDPPTELQPEQDICSIQPEHKLPFSHQAEKSNFNALKQKILKDVEIDKLLCKKCDIKMKHINELYDHIAGHYKWMRYACKLCNFKNYTLDKVLDHVKVVHKLKGDSDFYFSTVKALDGVEASLLSEFNEESNEINQTSPESRRPSRCSSDSSRLSDDSSSSSTRIEVGSRKRKTNPYRNSAKKKREAITDENDADSNSKDGEDSPQKDVIQMDNDSSSNSKVFDENSSDVDDSEEKSKRLRLYESSSVALRRPVRKRTKPKNEDFEYDLSNLLKMEAQGYRESQSVSNVKTFSNKKKTQDVQINYNSINKDCCGALYSLSRLAVDANKGHMKTINFAIFNATKEQRISNIFVRPMLPKISRIEKISPIKESSDVVQNKDSILESPKPDANDNLVQKDTLEEKPQIVPDKESNVINANNSLNNEVSNISEESPSTPIVESNSQDKSKNNLNLVPIKFRKQSLDLIKNPLIKKNITDFSKAGMKTKILVIKPINRKDGSQNTNAPLKFQTIKLKDPVNISSEEKKSDQVVVVKVPKVDCARPTIVTNNNNDSENTTTPDVGTKAQDSVKDKEESCNVKCDEEHNKNDDENAVCNIKNESVTADLCSNELILSTDTDVTVKS